MTEISLEDVAGWMGHHFRRIFHSREGTLELHLSLLNGVAERYEAPFFNALKQYSHRPTGVFHALPISQGKSIVNSHWIKDMIGFYGLDIFLAETSATCGGLDSLLEPTGPIRDAQELAAKAFGSRQTYFVTNCTFDGVVYDVERVMQECLGIKPDLVFLWDEAWFAFARFHPIYRQRTAMRAARTLHERMREPAYRQRYETLAGKINDASDAELLDIRLIPDPARTRIRVYATQSTHKTLTSLRQGSMIHVFDQDFGQKVEETFHEAYMTHTSTSPNYQI